MNANHLIVAAVIGGSIGLISAIPAIPGLQPAPVDFTGIAVLIGAITVAGTGIVTSVLTVLTFLRQGEAAKVSREMRDITIHTRDLVNGLSERKDAAIEKAAFAEGKEVGAEKERAAPMVPAPTT